MNRHRDDRFHPKVGPPRDRSGSHSHRFLDKVVKATYKAGGSRKCKGGNRPGSRLGRGHAASRFAGAGLTSRSRRVIIKTRLVVFRNASAKTTTHHLKYIARDGVGPQRERGKLYNALETDLSAHDFELRGQGDRHQFRCILSPEDGAEIGDLQAYTRQLMSRVEQDLGTKLEWAAVDHWDTDDPHTHIVIRGKDEHGKDLIIAADYITRGMRQRACELATEWLGERTDHDIHDSLRREVGRERWTTLDRELQRRTVDGSIDLQNAGGTTVERLRHAMLTKRLQRLAEMGLAERQSPGLWRLHPSAESTLRRMGERGDIIRTMQRALGEAEREVGTLAFTEQSAPIVGRIAGKGLADELHDVPYLVVDGIDGRAHHVTLRPGADLSQFPIDGIIDIRHDTRLRAADQNIARLAEQGIYRTDKHLQIAFRQERNPDEFVQAHVRRLEALRRVGIVERIEDGVWRVPADLPAKGKAYDVQRTGGMRIEVRSAISLRQQIRVIGVTWLDRQLVGQSLELDTRGFGAEVREALKVRQDVLIEQRLATRRDDRFTPARNLLDKLRARELDATAKRLEKETGLTYRPTVDGQRVFGVYRRPLNLVSTRFAMLEDGMGFSLVPWKPIIEKKIGHELSAVVRDSAVSWELGRQRGLSL